MQPTPTNDGNDPRRVLTPRDPFAPPPAPPPPPLGAGQPGRAIPPRARGGNRVIVAVVVVGIVVVGLLATCIGAAVIGAFGTLRANMVTEEAVARAERHPGVIAFVGQPVRAGMFVMGEFRTNLAGPGAGTSTGDADLRIPLRGPQARGVLIAQATRSPAGDWTFTTLRFEGEDGGSTTHDLLQGADPRFGPGVRPAPGALPSGATAPSAPPS